ncbi:MAG TPA: hypothetical protein PKE63_10610 [Lacibacter sp.]|nr:hypothetical protein [Lacibacter sp.]HMO89878.1 hypothetical protein [Lacibacter sp.]HMP87720.1 hypothetical protein [Lacibacter sp.]
MSAPSHHPQQEQLDALRDIRNLMERSSRFLALSGLSGVLIGLLGLACTAGAFVLLDLQPGTQPGYDQRLQEALATNPATGIQLMALFGSTLLLALLTGTVMALRKGKRLGLPLWDATARRLLLNFGLPLLAGGIYTGLLLHHGQAALALPATLLFYGLALVNASRYTISDIRHLGVLEMALGLLATWLPELSLLCWAAGFGLLHIVYGLVIYKKYEQQSA